jgi:hypothetical protein
LQRRLDSRQHLCRSRREVHGDDAGDSALNGSGEVTGELASGGSGEHDQLCRPATELVGDGSQVPAVFLGVTPLEAPQLDVGVDSARRRLDRAVALLFLGEAQVDHARSLAVVEDDKSWRPFAERRRQLTKPGMSAETGICDHRKPHRERLEEVVGGAGEQGKASDSAALHSGREPALDPIESSATLR